MTHASRAIAAAMLAATAARPQPAALSYVQEIQRAEVSDPRDEQWRRALGMYGGDAEHFGDCDQGGCNACILNDVHRIIYGVARQSEG